MNLTNILHNNNNLNKGGVEIFEVEENNKEEEDLVEEEAKSYVITMGIREHFSRFPKSCENMYIL